MLRRVSALFAVFLVSGMLTRAGFAGASMDATARQSTATAPVPASLAALTTLPALSGEASDLSREPAIDWPAQIDARLARLARAGARPSLDGSTAVAPDRRLRQAIDRALAPLDPSARAAVEIRDLSTGVSLASHEAQRPLNPASNQKLITAIAAIELLGPDYRFRTRVLRDGDALILQGEGDPDLHVAELHGLVTELLAIPGALDGVAQIIVDDGAFTSRSLGPGFRSDGCGDSYIAPSGALALDFATVEVSVRPGAFRGPAEVALSLPIGDSDSDSDSDGDGDGGAIEIVNHARTGHGRLEVCTSAGADGATVVTVSGSIPAGHAPIVARRRVHDPGLLTGAVLAQILREVADAPALPVVRGRARPTAQVLASHESAPLLAVLSSALRFSNNFTAEQVLRTLAWRASGRAGSWREGARVLERFAAALSPIHADDQHFVNGSGLSRDGRLTPAFIVDVLALAQRPGSPAQLLLASFAEAGGEGTLRNRLPGAGARVQAKTGTYAGASSLSGLVFDRRGERALGFSVLLNGGDLEANRATQDQLVTAMLRALD